MERADAESRQAEIAAQLEGLVQEYFAIHPGPEDPLACPLSVPLYGAEEVNDAMTVLLSQRVTMGPRVQRFEEEFARSVGTGHAVMVNSGSSANLLAVSSLTAQVTPQGLYPGDEVIVPAVTWPTTITPIIQNGCVPVFVDIDPATLNMQTDQLEKAWSPRTRAVFVVHLLGNPVDMEPVMEFARNRDLWVIEDTCESLGTTIGDEQTGSIGHIGTYSFYFSHHITTIEGGMLVTDDARVADLARSMRAHGWTRGLTNRDELETASPWIDPRFLFVHIGYNLRPMELQAAFGLAQLKRLEEFNDARRANAMRLLADLSDLSDELSFVTEQPGGRSTWFGFAVITKDAETRKALSKHLEAAKIETRPLVAGNLAVQPAFRDSPHRAVGSLHNASSIGQRTLYIGNHPDLDDARLRHIAETFGSFFR